MTINIPAMRNAMILFEMAKILGLFFRTTSQITRETKQNTLILLHLCYISLHSSRKQTELGQFSFRISDIKVHNM